ncbi:MAG: M20/M25/M40 family metallo-hydrolase [Phycisphaerales bacterium]|nr:M20/M25/M40 family metallo-hydrolase [Phycisphaerales bacterium]
MNTPQERLLKRRTVSAVSAMSLLLCLGALGSVQTQAHAAFLPSAALHVSVEPDWSELSAKKSKAGRLTFYGQPRKSEIEAFALAGGQVVINARTHEEMNKLGYDEQAFVESLGLSYVHIPTSDATFGYGLRDKFTKAMAETVGPVMFHCLSGSRAAGIYALSRVEQGGLSVDEAIKEAKSLGMSRGMVPLIRKTLEKPAPVPASVEPESETVEWSDIRDEDRVSGRLTFFGQPTKEEIIAFSESGGRVVINARTVGEMDKLDFDEQAFVESLGMEYVLIPTSSQTFGYPMRDMLKDTLDTTNGDVLFHCGSGSRAAAVYSLYIIDEYGLINSVAIQKSLDLGMSPKMVPLIERVLMEVPERVIHAVNPDEIQKTIDTLVGFGTRHTLSDTDSDTRGIGAARRWAKSQFEANIEGHGKDSDAAPRVYFDPHTVEPDGRRITEPVEVVNVICEIPGVSPESRNRLYYVLAHLDSRASEANDSSGDAPGANDDGSGVAALIELARVLSKEKLESTIILMATSGEEQGLFGARLHAQQAIADGKDIRGVLNNDTIGDPAGVIEGQDGSKVIRVFSEGLPASMLAIDDDKIGNAARRLRLYGTESDSTSRQLARYIADVAKFNRTTVQPKLIFRPDRFLRGGDHTPFNELGFAAIRFCEMYENYDHQHQDIRVEDGVQFGDLAEYVDAAYLADVTRLNAAVLVHLTNAPSSPGNARVMIAELTNDTTLRWDASPEADVAGYEIVWRESTSWNWEHSKDIGKATEGTVPLSKDNWLFGVRAYDKDGYRSPVSYPVPARD